MDESVRLADKGLLDPPLRGPLQRWRAIQKQARLFL
jgi:hypothetical protein